MTNEYRKLLIERFEKWLFQMARRAEMNAVDEEHLGHIEFDAYFAGYSANSNDDAKVTVQVEDHLYEEYDDV